MHHKCIIRANLAPKMKKPEEKFPSVSQPHHERSNNAILSWRRQQKMDGCSRNIDLVHFGTQKMPGKIGYCFKSGLAQYSSFIITMGLSFARYHLTRGDDPNFCSLLSLFRVLYKSLRPPRPKIQFRRKLAKTLEPTFQEKYSQVAR